MTTATDFAYELIIRNKETGADSGGVEFRTLEAAEKFIKAFWRALHGAEEVRHDKRTQEECGCWNWDVIESAWIADTVKGDVYFS